MRPMSVSERLHSIREVLQLLFKGDAKFFTDRQTIMGKSILDRSSSARQGSAGRADANTRADLLVSVYGDDSGELIQDIQSKVEALYGHSIRKTVANALAEFNFTSGRVEVNDRGALPFVIRARLETALRRAGFKGDGLVRRIRGKRPSTKRVRLRRSRLYLPGNEPKFMINAGLHRPDAIILDLEDSVHPLEKDAARLVVRNALAEVDFMGAERMVRINQLPLGFEDLDVIVPESPDLILLPKIESASEVKQVHGRIAKIQKAAEQEKTIWLMPILESALGIENAFGIASATETVVALAMGLEDYTADLGVRKTLEGQESLYARMRLVNAARAAGVQANDSVFSDVGDIAGLSASAHRSRGMGFEGMGCIHPRQIEPIHEAFAPTSNEIERARKICDAFEKAESKGLSVVSLGSRMIDPPVVLRARQLVENARKAGLIH